MGALWLVSTTILSFVCQLPSDRSVMCCLCGGLMKARRSDVAHPKNSQTDTHSRWVKSLRDETSQRSVVLYTRRLVGPCKARKLPHRACGRLATSHQHDLARRREEGDYKGDWNDLLYLVLTQRLVGVLKAMVIVCAAAACCCHSTKPPPEPFKVKLTNEYRCKKGNSLSKELLWLSRDC